MKYILSLVLLISASTCSIAQNNALIGDWKIVSIDNGEIYYNVKNDSISIYPEFSTEVLSQTPLGQMKNAAKMTYAETKFSFDDKGNFTWMFMPSVVDTLKYEVDIKTEKITVTGENSLGEAVTEEFSYKIRNNMLHFVVNFEESKGAYILERVKTQQNN